MPSSSADLLEDLQLVFVALTKDLAEAWTELVSDLPNAEVYRGSMGDVEADAVVSPANSYGFMDGGIDAHYMELYGEQIQFEARKAILTRHSGELLVGQADIVATGHNVHRWLIIAPTMRVPMALPQDTVNPFLAMRAALLLWRDGVILEDDRAGTPVRNVVTRVAVPGLGTGVGRVRSDICARQIRKAIEVCRNRDRLPQSWADASWEHQMLYTDSPGRLQPWH